MAVEAHGWTNNLMYRSEWNLHKKKIDHANLYKKGLFVQNWGTLLINYTCTYLFGNKNVS